MATPTPVSYSAAESPIIAGRAFAGQPKGFISFPETPGSSSGTYQWFLGTWSIAVNTWYDPDNVDFAVSYSKKPTLSANPRLLVTMHGSGGYDSFVKGVYGVATGFEVELRNQDGQKKIGDGVPGAKAEWWAFGTDGKPYPGRRIAGSLEHLLTLYPQIDVLDKGIVLDGPSMGGGGSVLQTMILPAPWRARIAYSRGAIGIVMPRRVYAVNPGQYTGFLADNGSPTNEAMWDSIDFSVQAASDPIVRGMHYRMSFSSNDGFSTGPDGNTQLEFVNLCEQHKIGCAAGWVSNGHSATETGVSLPWMTSFEAAEQDVTLDRAHPAITNSTGNWPALAADRVDEATYPRGHYNMGVVWDHANTIDSATEIIIPLRYTARAGLGGGIPDQPAEITVSVTPRRPRNFVITNGETLNWSFDGGVVSGTVVVSGDTATVDDIPLVSGQAFKNVRFWK